MHVNATLSRSVKTDSHRHGECVFSVGKTFLFVACVAPKMKQKTKIEQNPVISLRLLGWRVHENAVVTARDTPNCSSSSSSYLRFFWVTVVGLYYYHARSFRSRSNFFVRVVRTYSYITMLLPLAIVDLTSPGTSPRKSRPVRRFSCKS